MSDEYVALDDLELRLAIDRALATTELKARCQPLVDQLNTHLAEYRAIGADLPALTEPPKAMRISLRLKPGGIKVEE